MMVGEVWAVTARRILQGLALTPPTIRTINASSAKELTKFAGKLLLYLASANIGYSAASESANYAQFFSIQ